VPNKLTAEDFQNAADELGVSVAAVKAVAEVESGGDGFLPDGRPKILYERHIMRRELFKTPGFSASQIDSLAVSQPNLVNGTTGGYKGGAAEWERIDLAVQINRECALKSASYGKFQMMGFNHKAGGFVDVQAMVNAMFISEGEQLLAFVRFIKADAVMHRAIQDRDWPTLARRYNGVGYAINKYDSKLATAYSKFSQQNAA